MALLRRPSRPDQGKAGSDHEVLQRGSECSSPKYTEKNASVLFALSAIGDSSEPAKINLPRIAAESLSAADHQTTIHTWRLSLPRRFVSVICVTSDSGAVAMRDST